MTVALCGLSAASDAGVTESEVIFPLWNVRHGESSLGRCEYLPEAEEVSHLLLTRLVADVLDLGINVSNRTIGSGD